MNHQVHFDNKTLFIFPCCARKKHGGHGWARHMNGLKELIEPEIYSQILTARTELLNRLAISEITLGPDVGGNDLSGQYLSAIDRYQGSFYCAVPDFSHIVRKCLRESGNPHMLILSTFYGPLHPLDLIQLYNLKMDNRHARSTWQAYFPIFLREYVILRDIIRINLYFGSSTEYFRIVAEAVTPLVERGIVNEVIQYQIQNGGSYHTPHNHGLLIANHLGVLHDIPFTRKVDQKTLMTI